jgi:hypothetical protein
MSIHRVRRFNRFCPGACGSPFLGEFFFVAWTNSSRRFLGTAKTPRMTSLKRWNSGVESNGAAFILSPSVSGYVSRVPGAYGKEASSSAPRFACRFLVSQSPSDDLLHDGAEALGVSSLAVVIAECLIVKIAEQVKWLHADIGSVQAALQEAPEVLHRVRVNVPVRVLNGVVDDGVLVVCAQSIVGFEFVAEDRSASFDVLTNLLLQSRLAPIIYKPSPARFRRAPPCRAPSPCPFRPCR